MRPDLDIYEKIDLYLENKLSSEELHMFENEMMKDDLLKSRVETVKSTNNLLVSIQLNDLKSKMKKDMKSIPFEPEVTKINFWPWILASIGILASSVLFYSLNKTDESIGDIKINKEKVSVNTPQNKPIVAENEPKANKKEIKNNEILMLGASPIIVIEPEIIHQPVNKIPDVAIEKNNVQIINNVIKQELVNHCVGVLIDADVQFKSTCVESPTGEIIFDKVINGKAPFVYSINNGESFEPNNHFNNLQANNYFVSIKDANGCETKLKPILLTSKTCTKASNEFAFSPSLNESFKFPIEHGDEGKIQILTRNGQIVFTANISEIQEWNGESNTGFGIGAGVYVFIIEYKNGKLQKGYVTLY